MIHVIGKWNLKYGTWNKFIKVNVNRAGVCRMCCVSCFMLCVLWCGLVAQSADPPAGGLLSWCLHCSMFTTYAIMNECDRIYIGHTSDLEARLKRHNGLLKNKARSYMGRNKGMWKLVYKEEFNTRRDAIEREKQLKSYQGRNFIRNIVENLKWNTGR